MTASLVNKSAVAAVDGDAAEGGRERGSGAAVCTKRASSAKMTLLPSSLLDARKEPAGYYLPPSLCSLHLPPDQSDACTEYDTSLSGSSGFLSRLLHPNG